MFYPKSKEKFNLKNFENPSKEYRAAPFWAWNTKLDPNELTWQMEILKKMGCGGVHIHSRTGMATPYLSDEYMDLVRTCVEKAKSEDMLIYLYDEDRWPSGTAGGFVTKRPEFRQRYLKFQTKRETEDNFTLIATYDLIFDSQNSLESWEQIGENVEAKGQKYFAYEMVLGPGNAWFNHQCYVDILNPKAIEYFIELTHKSYKKHFGKEFQKYIPSIFTDEPQVTSKTFFDKGKRDFFDAPWTNDFEKIYLNKYNQDLIKNLPLIFFDTIKQTVNTTRYNYHELTTELFATAFADQCGIWCKENNLPLTGHVMNEQSLISQTRSVGDAMRHYRHFGLPGIDMLLNGYEFITAKQAQSASRQNGNEGILCELDGVTNWNFDFRGHKLHGDWQAALGVTLRVPHLSWVSMNGDAKRDYPASINYQAAWWEKYHLIEDYFARVGSLTTRGVSNCKVAVIHPIRDAWLYFGDNQKNEQKLKEIDSKALELTEELVKNNVDFDFVCEGNLELQYKNTFNEKFKVGEMSYDVIIVPELETIKSTTLKILKEFKGNGGKIIFAGQGPIYLDAKESLEPQEFFRSCNHINSNKDIPDSIEYLRDYDLLINNKRTYNYCSQMRVDQDCSYLFIARAREDTTPDIIEQNILTVKIKGEYFAEIFDCFSGTTVKANQEIINSFTYIEKEICNHDSLMLRLTPQKSSFTKTSQEQKEKEFITQLSDPCSFNLSEPNVLLLDMAQYSLNDEDFNQKEEFLKLDSKIRSRLNIPQKGEGVAQPWVIENNPEPKDTLTIKIIIKSKIQYKNAILALETPQNAQITFNNLQIELNPIGYYVDKCIKKIHLGDLNKGDNELIVKIPIGEKTCTEAMYLLGDFGVYFDQGGSPYIDNLPNKINFANIVPQGLAFYGGNITYNTTFDSNSKTATLQIPSYSGGLCDVTLNGEFVGDLVFAPYTINLYNLKPTENNLSITLYGTRINTFGQLHKVNHAPREWYGPESWFTSGSDWTYSYNTWEQGILKPILLNSQKPE